MKGKIRPTFPQKIPEGLTTHEVSKLVRLLVNGEFLCLIMVKFLKLINR